ncbi:hypothetical protein V8F20_004720 [Naviculisporaceae sp. PSN 640]
MRKNKRDEDEDEDDPMAIARALQASFRASGHHFGEGSPSGGAARNGSRSRRRGGGGSASGGGSTSRGGHGSMPARSSPLNPMPPHGSSHMNPRAPQPPASRMAPRPVIPRGPALAAQVGSTRAVPTAFAAPVRPPPPAGITYLSSHGRHEPSRAPATSPGPALTQEGYNSSAAHMPKPPQARTFKELMYPELYKKKSDESGSSAPRPAVVEPPPSTTKVLNSGEAETSRRPAPAANSGEDSRRPGQPLNGGENSRRPAPPANSGGNSRPPATALNGGENSRPPATALNSGNSRPPATALNGGENSRPTATALIGENSCLPVPAANGREAYRSAAPAPSGGENSRTRAPAANGGENSRPPAPAANGREAYRSAAPASNAGDAPVVEFYQSERPRTATNPGAIVNNASADAPIVSFYQQEIPQPRSRAGTVTTNNTEAAPVISFYQGEAIQAFRNLTIQNTTPVASTQATAIESNTIAEADLDGPDLIDIDVEYPASNTQVPGTLDLQQNTEQALAATGAFPGPSSAPAGNKDDHGAASSLSSNLASANKKPEQKCTCPKKTRGLGSSRWADPVTEQGNFVLPGNRNNSTPAECPVHSPRPVTPLTPTAPEFVPRRGTPGPPPGPALIPAVSESTSGPEHSLPKPSTQPPVIFQISNSDENPWILL